MMISVPAATTALTFSTIILIVRRSLKQGMMTERVILLINSSKSGASIPLAGDSVVFAWEMQTLAACRRSQSSPTLSRSRAVAVKIR